MADRTSSNHRGRISTAVRLYHFGMTPSGRVLEIYLAIILPIFTTRSCSWAFRRAGFLPWINYIVTLQPDVLRLDIYTSLTLNLLGFRNVTLLRRKEGTVRTKL